MRDKGIYYQGRATLGHASCFVSLDFPPSCPPASLFLLALRNFRKSHRRKNTPFGGKIPSCVVAPFHFSRMQSCSSHAYQTPKSIPVCSTEISGIYLFPFSAVFANTVTLLWKSWSLVVDVYLFVKHQFEMPARYFLFNFQLKSQVKTCAFVFSVAISYFFLSIASIKPSTNNTKIT